MSNYAGFTVLGASGQNERTASSVTNIGDINGDGLSDFAISVPGAEAPYSGYYGEGTYNRYNGGAVYVVFGDEDEDGDGPDTGLPTSINVDDLDGTNGFRINPDGDLFDRSAFYDAGFGVDVTALGDVNGDGIDDFGVAQSATNYVSYYGGGFYGEYGPQTPDGVAYVILGGQNFEAEQEVDDLAGFRIDTESRVEEIVALGDVNGDGFADVGLNTVDRQTDYTYVDFTYLSDYNGNGVYDAYDPETFPYFESYYDGSARVSIGVSTSYVIFGTDQDRVSDDPIAQSGGGFGGQVLTQTALAVPDDAPTTGETIVDATQLDGSDGFSINTGTTLTQTYNFSEFAYGYFGSTYGTGGIAGAGDINGDGINDIIATERGYYQPLLNSGETLNIVRDANTGDVTFTPSDYFTADSSSGNFVIFGNALGDSFLSEIPLLTTTHQDVDLQSFFDFDGTVQGIGDVSGNDNLDELAFAEFLSPTQVARDAEGNLLRDADGNLISEDNPDSPFDVFTNGVAIINGTAGGFLSDGSATNRIFDFGDLVNGQGSFITDTSSRFVRDFDTGEISSQGVFIDEGPGQITGIGDINNDGIEDFAFVAQRTDQVEDELPVLVDDEVPVTGEVIQRNASQDVVYLVFGQADPLTGLIDLADTFDSGTAADERLAFRIEGLQSSFFFGEFDRGGPTDARVNVSGGDDINGDGISDVVIGSPGTDGPGFDDGAAFVVFGGLDALAAADAADGQSDGIVDAANLGVNVETGVLPITVSLRDAGFFSRFQSEGDIGATPFTFEVTRSGDLSEEVSFDFTVTPSGFDPAEAEDFVGGAFPTDTVTFADGADTALVTVEVQGDFVLEGTEDFTVTISNATTDGPSPISINGDSTFARIFNDDQPVRFFAGNGSVTEGDVDADNSELVLTVFRSGETQVAASVDFEIQLTSAELDDFEAGVLPLSGTLDFDVGETSREIVLPIAEDIQIEGNEQVRLLLSNATSEAPVGSPPGTVIPAIISDSVGVGTIVTDDFAVEFRVSNAFVIEGDEASGNRELVFTVTRSGDLDPAAQVDLSFVMASFNAADADDFEVNPFGTQTVFFDRDQTTQTIRLAIDEDVDIEANERIDARLSNQQLSDGSTDDVLIFDGFGVGTINNDDFPPRISVNGGGSRFEGTGPGTTTFTFEVTRTGDTTGVTDVTFDLNPLPFQGNFFAADSQDIAGITIDGAAVTGSGFLPLFGQTVRFEDGESVKSVTVDVVRDGIIEPREQFELRITEVDALNRVDYDIFTPARTATILNDDGRPPVIPPGVEADVFGDPHIVTLDGLGYDFQATGEYILVETLEGALNPFQVQVRFEPLPGSDLVSTTTRMAVQIGDATLEIDALGNNPLLITDASGTRTPTVEELALGAADINGDTINDVFFNEDLSEFFIALNDLGPDPDTGETRAEQLMVKNMDGTLNVCVFLSDLPGGNQGNVRGLMGDADGTGDTTDDLALREGTIVPVGSNLVDINGDPIPEDTPLTSDVALPQPVDFATLYGIYAISWNLDGANGKDSFFTGDPLARDPDFPAALLTIDDLPDDVRAAAEAAVLAAQDPNDPLDPAIFEAAVLDFALTGNPDFISGALGLAAEQNVETEPTNAPELPVTVSVSADPTGLTEGDTGSQNVVFTFSRLDDAMVPLSIAYAITGTADASDVAEGTDFTGTIDFTGEEMTQTVTIEVLGDLLTEDDETLIVTITDAGDALIAGATAEVIIATDDFAPEAQDDAFSTDEDTSINRDVFSDNQIEDPADNSDIDADGDDLSVVNVTLSDGAVRAANGGLIILPTGAHLRINADGTFDYDPFGFSDALGQQDDTIFDQLGAGEVATETFSYLVTDGNSGEDTATVTITVQGVDDAPVAVIDEFIVDENSSVSGNVIDGNISPDFDPEGGDLTVTRIDGVLLADADEDAGAEGAQITIGDGGILTVFGNGDVSFDTNGAYEDLGDGEGQIVSRLQSVLYEIADAGGSTDTAALRFSVRGVNDDPLVSSTIQADVFEDDLATDIDLLLNASDIDTGDVLGVANVSTLPQGFSLNGTTLTVDTEDAIFDQLADGDTQEVTISYDVTDGTVFVPTSAEVTITGVNDAPVVSNTITALADEDDAAFDIDLLQNTSDVDLGETLSVINPDSPATGFSLTGSTLTVDPTNAAFQSLSLGQNQVETFNYTVTDGDEVIQTFAQVTITGTNDDPDAVDDSYSTDEGQTLTVNAADGVLANDTDIDALDSLTADLSVDANGGMVFLNSDGSFTYMPNADFVGTDTFSYEASDGRGGTDIATVSITVNALANNDPVAADDSYSVNEDALLTVDAINGVLSNDTDVDLDTLFVLDVATDVTDGQLTLNQDGSFTYDPDDDFFGTDEFTYRVSDGRGGTDIATATITVDPINDDPIANDDTGTGYVTDEDTAFTTANVLLNDTDTEQSSLTVISVDDSATLGEVTSNGDGTFDYDPNGAFEALNDGDNATDTFVYTVSDGNGGTDTATVTVEIDGVDDATGTPVIQGTLAGENLVGSDLDDIIRTGGGSIDFLTGGGGSDIFVIEALADQNGAEIAFITDYEIGVDKIDLNGRNVAFDLGFGNTVLLILDGTDFDYVGVEVGIDDIEFV